MEDIKKLFFDKKIPISLRIYEESDISNQWEISSILDNQDIFNDFYKRFPLEKIENLNAYYLYFLSIKISNLKAIEHLIIEEKNRKIIDNLANSAEETLKKIKSKDIIQFINSNIQTIFDADQPLYDLEYVTIEFIGKTIKGIDSSVLSYLCERYGYLIIDRFDCFEKTFEEKPELFKRLFPSGKLENIHKYRFEPTLAIWHHIVSRKESNLKEIVNEYVLVLFDELSELAKSATLDNVLQVEGEIREFNDFLKRIGSKLANEFSNSMKLIDDLIAKHIEERGQKFEYKIPIGEMLEDINKQNDWVKRMLLYTHSKKQVGSNIVYASRLSDHQPGKVSLVDFVSTNIPTDDYFTMSHQQNLSILSSIETPLIYALLHDQKMLMDYLNMIIGAMKYISDAWGNDDEHLVDDAKMLTNMIGILANNIKSEKIVLSSLCYSVAMFTCSISEKLLRLYYFRKIRNQQYFLASNATLGKLLNETTPEINALFGEDHIKNLSFFLQESGPKRIGHNYRNKLAHWSDISDKVLNPYFAALILWLFTDILNTVFLQVLIENGDISTSIE